MEHDENDERATALLDGIERLIDARMGAPGIVQRSGAIPGLAAEPMPRIPGFADEASKFSLLKAAQLAMHENPASLEKTHGFELEAMRAQRDLLSDDSLVARTLSAATGTSGGFIVPTEVAEGVLRSVIEATILGKLGVRRVTASKGALLFNKSSNVEAEWIDTEVEQSLVASDPSFSQIRLSPRALGCITGLTYGMTTQSDPAVEGIVRDLMAARIAQKIDKDFFLGSGVASQPRGLFNHPEVSTRTVSFSGLKLGPTAVGADGLLTKLRAMVAKIRTDSAPTQRLAFFGEPKAAEAPEIAVDTRGKPIFLETSAAQVETLLGRPFGITASLTNATTTALRFGVGDFSQAVLANWGALAFATSNSHGNDFATGVTRLRCISLWDSAVLEPLAFVLATAFSAADVVNS